MMLHMQQLHRWPEPLLQPDKKKDCMIYSTAYLCRCLGYADVTPEQVRAYREETRFKEVHFPETLGIAMDCYWRYEDEQRWKQFWLGVEQKAWVQQRLAQGYLALAAVHRVPEMGHIVVLLDADETGVLLADPALGHVCETWEWFLGTGARKPGCHRIDGWYRLPETAVKS